LLSALEDPTVFAAVPRIRRPLEGGVAESAIAAQFRRGLFRLQFLGDAPFEGSTQPFPTLYPVGAAAVFRREPFLELGGLDPLYTPYYWEDADLGYRAWKAGYRVLCVPQSVVDHYSGSISSTQPAERIALAQGAHRFLFTWKNLHDPWWTLSHWLWLGPHCLAAACTGRATFVWELWTALRRLPEALRGRRAARRRAKVLDREVLAQRLPPPG
jgi:GT2 family glycosyltransferase